MWSLVVVSSFFLLSVVKCLPLKEDPMMACLAGLSENGLEKPVHPNHDSRVKYVLTVSGHDNDLGLIQAGGSYNVSLSGQYGSQFRQLVVVASRGRLQPLPGVSGLRAGTCLGLSTVTNTDNRTTNTVFFTWVAPDERPLDEECVTIRAAVVDDKQFLYQNDDPLTAQLCSSSWKQRNPSKQSKTSTLQSPLRRKPTPSSSTRPESVLSSRNQNHDSAEKEGIHVYQAKDNIESSTVTVNSQLQDFPMREMLQSMNGGYRTGKRKTQPQSRRFRNLLNILVRHRRESPSSRTDLATTTEDDRSLKWRLISKACCRSGSRFGSKPHPTDCDEASRKFVSRNIAELTHLQPVCVEQFSLCCKAKQKEGGYLIDSSDAGREDQPTDDSTDQRASSETAISDSPTGASSSTAVGKEISTQQACCLNGLRTAYDSDKSCVDEGKTYANQTDADEQEYADAATACLAEFSRCCEELREHVGGSHLPHVDVSTLQLVQDLQLEQHCCRQGSVEGLSPEADCEQSATEYVRLPLRNSTDRQLQCSGKYTECCSARQAQNANLIALIYPSIRHNKTLKTASLFKNVTTDDVQSQSTDIGSIIDRIWTLEPQVTNVLQSETTPLRMEEEDSSQSEQSSAALTNFDRNGMIQPVTEVDNPSQLAEGPTTAPLRPVTEGHMTQSIFERSREPTASPSPMAQRSQSPLSWYDIGTDTLVVLSKHRRTLRLCCLQGKAVDVDTDHPESCQLDAESYTSGTRLTDRVKQCCKDIFVHCCESMDPGHRGTTLTRASVSNIRRLLTYSGENTNRDRYYS